MTNSVEQILSDVIQQLNKDGYPCSGRIGENWLLSRVSDTEFPAFLFDIISDDINIEDHAQQVKIVFILCFPSEEHSNTFNIENFNNLRLLYTKFFDRLKKHEVNGQQLTTITRATRKPYYFNMKFLERKTKGFRCDLDLKIEATQIC